MKKEMQSPVRRLLSELQDGSMSRDVCGVSPVQKILGVGETMSRVSIQEA